MDPVNPIDARRAPQATPARYRVVASPQTAAGDVIYGYCVRAVTKATCTFGSGFTARSTFNKNLIEDKIASTAGIFCRHGQLQTMAERRKLVAFKLLHLTLYHAAFWADGLSATAVSASQINLSWFRLNDNVGVAGYHVLRNSVQIATISGTSYTDSGLAASTTYSYTVNAFDAAGNVSAQSTV